MYHSISLESIQMCSRPVQVQDETEQISPVQSSSGNGEDPGGDGEDPGGDGEDSGGGDPGGGDPSGGDPGGGGAASAGESAAAGVEGAAAGAEGAAANSEDFVTPVQVEESTEIYSEISDVEERRYCDFSSERNIEMNLELACVESEEMKRLYRNTEKVKFNISTYNLVVYIMINSSVYSRADLNVQSELEMGVSSSINKSLLIMTCCLLLLYTGLSVE